MRPADHQIHEGAYFIRGASAPTAIEQRFDGDLEAVKAYLRATTLREAAADFSVEISTVQWWERKYGAHCQRVCECCKKEFAYADMALVNGKVTPRCVRCPPRQKKPRVVVASTADEFAGIPHRILELARTRIGRPSPGRLSYLVQAR